MSFNQFVKDVSGKQLPPSQKLVNAIANEWTRVQLQRGIDSKAVVLLCGRMARTDEEKETMMRAGDWHVWHWRKLLAILLRL